MRERPLIGIPAQTLHAIDGIPEHLPESWVMSRRYFDAVTSAGAVPWMIPLLEGDTETLREIYERLDGLFLVGGVDVHPDSYGDELDPLTGRTDPPRDRVELLLARWALEDGKPVLGACRGIQTLNVAAGGNLFQDVHEQRPDSIKHDYFTSQGYARDHLAHDVELVAGSRLQRVFGSGRIQVNSMHHQGVRDLASGLVATARAADGLVEGLEAAGGAFVVGVQWHPEMLASIDRGTRRLFEAFLDAAVEFRNGSMGSG